MDKSVRFRGVLWGAGTPQHFHPQLGPIKDLCIRFSKCHRGRGATGGRELDLELSGQIVKIT